MKIFIDPGHGGKFPGAVGPGGTLEKDINLQIALELGAELLRAGQEVRFSRSSDSHLSNYLRFDLRKRAKAANRWPADVFLSIHCNSVEDESVRGFEAYHYPGSIRGSELAKHICTALLRVFANNRGVKQADDLYVLRATRAPAVLVELEFLSNPEAEKCLREKSVQLAIGHSLARAIQV